MIGYVGSRPWDRGGAQLLEAAARLLPRFPQLGVVIVGSGEPVVAMKRRAAELGIAEHCHFAGYVPYRRIPLYVKSLDVGVSISLQPERAVNSELKVRQYLACGKPIVISPGGNDFVPEQGFGTVVEPADLGHHRRARTLALASSGRARGFRFALRPYMHEHLSMAAAIDRRIRLGPSGCRPEMAAPVTRLVEAFERERIPFCQWKGARALERALRGERDLDWLVRTSDWERVLRAIEAAGWKRALPRRGADEEGIAHFYAFDPGLDPLLHLHLHDRVLSGEDWINSHALPFGEDFLASPPADARRARARSGRRGGAAGAEARDPLGLVPRPCHQLAAADARGGGVRGVARGADALGGCGAGARPLPGARRGDLSCLRGGAARGGAGGAGARSPRACGARSRRGRANGASSGHARTCGSSLRACGASLDGERRERAPAAGALWIALAASAPASARGAAAELASWLGQAFAVRTLDAERADARSLAAAAAAREIVLRSVSCRPPWVAAPALRRAVRGGGGAARTACRGVERPLMPRLLAAPLPPGCPWSGFTPPNVDWCEEELCAWIVNPADTWSNLAYVVLGLFMWWAARHAGAATSDCSARPASPSVSSPSPTTRPTPGCSSSSISSACSCSASW